MGAVTGRILKRDSIKVEGKFQLGIMQKGGNRANTPAVHVTEPKVRIVESNSEFTIMEVTCSCGTKTSVRCEYAAPTAAAATEPSVS